ncbi:MAG: hypothetical protein HY043_10835 [Verrucomicrobia bacterium]|nr:hypothetical protein [Verrucomicrobiota bacterium]
MRWILILASWVAASFAGAATFQENFDTDPQTHGWQIFSDAELFRWNATNQNLAVTWDSSEPNSYFQLPLGTILTRHDDFGFALDLRLDDIAAGVNTNKPTTFALAFGFQNADDAERTNFFRGSGHDSPNLVEFNFFSDTGFGPTIWPAIWSTNSILSYNGTSDFTILDLPVSVVLHIAMNYTASNETAQVSITANGAPLGFVAPITLSRSFTQFRLDTFAIESYSDAGQSSSFPGSLFAHGTVDNVVVTAPPPPVENLRAVFAHGQWQVVFLSHTNWSYALEATTDFRKWNETSSRASGTGVELSLADENAANLSARFYRVSAQPVD